ncbi:MAG: N-acetylmuramic acid 6-phosphate etherase [Clostridia bacterium]|nr:N-acetylmuramic acid 6-phosphate etherase [Clostridia bacterium]
MDTKALLASLGTEQVNSRSERLDQMNSLEIATLMNDVTADVTAGINQALPQIAQAIDGIVARLRAGGRLIYMGAGTSGRLGVLDASECPPTFGVSPELVQGIIAGGDRALRTAVEGAEDSETLPVEDLKARSLCEKDAVVAISASGYAPYCVAALKYARSVGALAISLSCNTGARTSREADIAIEAPTGGEVLSGSTRLKAGTATKLILNMLSTGSMVQLGKCYKNLMVDVKATNVKLRDRSIRITMNATGLDRDAAEALYERSGGIKQAIVMHETGAAREQAEDALKACGGSVRGAIAAIRRG